MIHNKKIFVLVLIGLITLASAQVDTAWTRRWTSAGPAGDYVYGLAVDNDGNVCVSGCNDFLGPNPDLLIIKYQPNGDTAWIRNPARTGSQQLRSVVVGASGNIYSTGYTMENGNGDYITIKYRPNGDQAWVVVRPHAGTGYDFARKLVLDAHENVYITGYAETPSPKKDVYVTVKYDSSGTQLWARQDSLTGAYSIGYPTDLAIDNSGNPFIVSKVKTRALGQGDDYMVIKYNTATGDTFWARTYNGVGDTTDEARAVAFDDLNNVYVTGMSASTSTGNFDYNIVTIKYNSDGVQQWVRSYTNPDTTATDAGYWIAVDGSGYVYVYGTSYTPGGDNVDLVLIKYDASGNEKWVSRYNGPAGTHVDGIIDKDGQNGMAIDPSGNIYIAGLTRQIDGPGTQSTENDFIIIRFNHFGDTVWTARYNYADSFETTRSMTIDNDGNVYVTGQSVSPATYYDVATIKYSQTTHRITATAYDGGTITPFGSVIVPYSSYTTFTITPDANHHLDSLIVDGIYHGPDSISYTFENVLTDHAIDAYFSINTYTITATTTTGGSIIPSDDVIIEYGADTTFTISANSGYVLDSVLVDDVSVGAVTSYPFIDVTADHTIYAMFTMTALPGWAQKESVVTPHTDKTIKDGGALVGVPGSDKDAAKLYALLGTKTNRFRKYTVGLGWSDAETLLFGHKYNTSTHIIDTVKFAKKFPGKGAALCYDGTSKIYATKGNGTNEFFVYDMTSDAGWTAKAYVPTLKGLKGGTSIRYYDGKVYLMAGGQKKDPTVNNFWVYEPTADSAGGTPWTALGKLPLGPNTKVWKDGASIIEVGGTFYAVKSADKTNLFYAYDWGTNEWLTKEEIPIDDSSYHKYKKKLIVKDGAATATDGDVIYATKGGGTEVFWKYTPGTTGVWERLDRLPIEKADKKHAPKTGAAMTFVDGKVWLLVGNKQVDFWCYVPTAAKSEKRIANSVNNVIARSAQTNAAISNFSITPNPFSKLTTIRYTVPISGKVSLKLYNSTGRLIETLVNTNLDAGSYTSTLSTIAKGVYFLKYESNTNKTEVKLIVQ